jgi:hypothetical protein
MTELTEEQATKVIQEASRKKLEAFQNEFNKLCDKHGCDIIGIPSIQDGRIVVILQARIR